MTPGLLYVGVSTLTGSVIGRRRNLLVRVLLPPAFFALSLGYFLPKTAQNLTAYLSTLERTYAPTLADRHSDLNRWLSQSLGGMSKTYSDAKATAAHGIQSARRQLEQQTGLKVGDLGVDPRMEEVKTQGQGTLARIQEETRKFGDQVQSGVEELKSQAEGGLEKEEREDPPKRLV